MFFYAFWFLIFSQNVAPICFLFLVVSALLILVFMKLLYYRMLNNTCLYILHIVSYNIKFLCGGGHSKTYDIVA